MVATKDVCMEPTIRSLQEDLVSGFTRQHRGISCCFRLHQKSFVPHLKTVKFTENMKTLGLYEIKCIQFYIQHLNNVGTHKIDETSVKQLVYF